MNMAEMRGQLGELIKLVTANNAKLDELNTQVMRHEDLPVRLTAIELRVTALEAADNRRVGAMSLTTMLIKSPAIGWAVGAMATVWALLTGHLKI